MTHREFRHALVIGKFYPPHNGHIHLMEQALEVADRVTILVYGTQYQHIALADRTEWIREYFEKHYKGTNRRAPRVESLLNDVYDDYVDMNVWEAHDHIMKAKLRQMYGGSFLDPDSRTKIDVIVSSEDYGEQLTQYFPGSSNYVVDQPRTTHPISGTAARNDLFGNWKHLPIPTRKGLIPRVIVLGAESTGTTTLSLALTEHYQARYVPEYGRDYTVEWLETMRESNPNAKMEDLVWRPSDFERIGKYQTVLENRAASKLEGFPLVIGDTDAFATAVWENRYLGTTLNVVLDEPYAQVPHRDLYLLTDHVGVEWEDDGFRDGQDIRAGMTEVFEDALTERGYSWALLRGSHEERMKIAVKMIDKVLTERLDFD
jgi:HTH-type transcriptional regulator, transcriptional repressor of NAD biosynthesis genes